MTPTSTLQNRTYRLRRRPVTDLSDGALEFATEALEVDLAEGEVLLRNLYLSLDPTNRIWASDYRGYMPPVPLDDVMRGVCMAEVLESRREDLPVGAKVVSSSGWQDYCVASDESLGIPIAALPDPVPAPLSTFVGVLGHNGATAYIGFELGPVKAGETVVVSGAAGATGSVAGQIAKARGARVVGIAGGPAKCEHVVKHLGFDACVDYKADDWRDQLDHATPDGIDVDFENVGGEIMDHVLSRLNIGARVLLCGMISQYNDYGHKELPGQHQIAQILMQRATMAGFLVLDHAELFEPAAMYLVGLMMEGKLVYDETVVDGLENAVAAYDQLYSGGNLGKLVVKVADPST
ncbi:NADP-dependent oxidoreductase [Sporichthya sp.]|uniref:NADP-dependent oxidoreductase n=1 Tax=Sporichthya sp. TaxID=65475 RepID=UPI0017C5F37E|nr:NADP-dependent oxidoreductase [Sporichthya sp.]MBA3743592.1 NADP-dependent oxidoreductase [Sporichthya sp.]